MICCICGKPVETNDKDAYSLQIRKLGIAPNPEMIWGHGPCLREAIPIIGVEIPRATK